MNNAFVLQDVARFAEVIADVSLAANPIEVTADAGGEIDLRSVRPIGRLLVAATVGGVIGLLAASVIGGRIPLLLLTILAGAVAASATVVAVEILGGDVRGVAKAVLRRSS